MFNLSTSNSELRFAFVVLSALLSFVLMDDILYRQGFFLKFFGDATQEGQVIAKKERFVRYADVVDVILFGSSFTRSGISSEPFTKARKLVFNAGVSGGGPLYSYFALDEMAEQLRKRDRMPLLVLELHPDALLRDRPRWSEYPQFAALVREKGRIFRNIQLLFQNFLAYGQESRFLSGLLFPSLIYREHNRQVQHGLGEQFRSGRRPMEGYFIGMEDHGGYAPIYTTATGADCASGVSRDEMLPLHTFEPTKIAFVRRFLELATTLGAQVLVIERPNLCNDQLLARLVDELRREYPTIAYFPSRELGLSTNDFQSPSPAAHPNLWGADKVGTRIARYMDSLVNKVDINETFPERWGSVYKEVKCLEWASVSDVSKAQGGRLHLAEVKKLDGKVSEPIAWTREFFVEPGKEYILEGRAKVSSGLLQVKLEYRKSRETEFLDGGYYSLPDSDKQLRHFIRFRSSGESMRILLRSVDPQHTVIGEYELLRMLEDGSRRLCLSNSSQIVVDACS